MASITQKKVQFREVTEHTDFCRIAQNESIWHGMCNRPSVDKRNGDYMAHAIQRTNTDIVLHDSLGGEFPAKWSATVLAALWKDGYGSVKAIGAYQLIHKPHGTFRNLCGYIIADEISRYETMISRCYVHPSLDFVTFSTGLLTELKRLEFCRQTICVRIAAVSVEKAAQQSEGWFALGFVQSSVVTFGKNDYDVKLTMEGRK